MLPRIRDKGRASLTGKLGAYHYRGVGLDRHFFKFVGLDHESLKQELAKGGGDGEVLAWVQENAKFKREPWEILAWSEWFTKRAPDSDAETISEFAEMVAKFDAERNTATRCVAGVATTSLVAYFRQPQFQSAHAVSN